MQKLLLLLIPVLFFSSCSSTDTDYGYDRFAVASKKTLMRYNNGSWAEGYVVKRVVENSEKSYWSYFPYEIADFVYTPGIEYLLHVRVYEVKNEDGEKVKEYRLHRVVSETEKTSEDLPDYEVKEYRIASELRRKDNTDIGWYIAKSKDESGEWGSWDYLAEEKFFLDKIEFGSEYLLKLHVSNVSGENKSTTELYFRIMEELEKYDVQSDDLPGYPMEI